jgi:hypothetical protein
MFQVTAIQAPRFDSVELSSSAEPVSLEARMLTSVADAALGAARQREEIMQAVSAPEVVSNPGKLIKLQMELSDYVLEMNLKSILARKTVSVVETLVKA